MAEQIREGVAALRRDGIDREQFELIRRATYGRYIGLYSRTEPVAGLMCAAHFAGIDDIFSLLDVIANATLEQMEERLRVAFDPEKSALSIVRPQDSETGGTVE